MKETTQKQFAIAFFVVFIVCAAYFIYFADALHKHRLEREYEAIIQREVEQRKAIIDSLIRENALMEAKRDTFYKRDTVLVGKVTQRKQQEAQAIQAIRDASKDSLAVMYMRQLNQAK